MIFSLTTTTLDVFEADGAKFGFLWTNLSVTTNLCYCCDVILVLNKFCEYVKLKKNKAISMMRGKSPPSDVEKSH